MADTEVVRHARYRSLRIALVALAWLGPLRASGQGGNDAAPVGQAQEGSAESSNEVVPPKILKDAGVSYPQEALQAQFHERVEVSLILELDPAGNPLKASVESPQGLGFDEAALEAARHLRFEPARRAGKPIGARIRKG